MSESNWVFKLLMFASAAILATWISLPAAVRVLCILMICDYATGMIAAYQSKKLNSSIGARGLLTKVAILILLGALHRAAEIVHVGESFNEWFSSGIATFFVINELISVVENCVVANVKVPPNLIYALEKVKHLGGWDGKRERRLDDMSVSVERRTPPEQLGTSQKEVVRTEGEKVND